MFYYHVLARLKTYHGSGFLTYQSEKPLKIGSVVQVTVRREMALGIVIETVKKPAFATKPITAQILDKPLPAPTIKLLHWLMAYYPSPLGMVAQQFLPAALANKLSVVCCQSSVQTPTTENRQLTTDNRQLTTDNPSLPPLTPEQKKIFAGIKESASGTLILHGDTGSGKTRVYAELTRETLATGQSVLILTPEIGLTPQLVTDFQASFAEHAVVLLHSGLSVRQRRVAWLEILHANQPLIIIGPRSALFSPVQQLGLIVVDECHEPAYKQEQAPHYQAVRVASQLARIHGAKLILGSATPNIQDYYIAQAKQLPILRMRQLAMPGTHVVGAVEVVDMRGTRHRSRSPHFSTRLLEATAATLERGEQTLIFLNRRGTARLVLCATCGWQANCPHCDIPLTYHGDHHRLQCHTCGFRSAAPSGCPECGSADIGFKSAGTKSIVTALEREFPHARIRRFDTDSKASERIDQQYQAIVSGEVDILVGTQMIAKGLDLPKLSLVGVIAADTSLYFPDYTAEERTYQLLSQVIGRVGRGHREGMAIIQTYTPDNPTLTSVVSKDWAGFYARQLEQRQQFLFPPFCHVLKLSCARASQKSAESAAAKLASELRDQHFPVQITGPSPAYVEKVAGKYRQQLIIKSKNRSALLKIIPLLPSGWLYDLDPTDLL